jgi:DMSO/TMAO reductase YedYZ molybdopterin-dependent catalytic subunit
MDQLISSVGSVPGFSRRFMFAERVFGLYEPRAPEKTAAERMKETDAGELSVRSSETQAFAGLIVRDRNPENLEFPFSTLNSFITSNEQFFVRSHFDVPKLETDGWRLIIEGRVEKPCEIGYDELLNMPSRTVTMTLECAGNSRIFLSPKVGGLQWELGAVSNAEWTGVPLAAVLKRAGIRAGAIEVVLEGADHGVITKEPMSPGKIHYARSLPLAKALMPEVVLAYSMNGEPLSPSHGFPLRAIVPGWYGMASVKWLSRIVVADTSFRGYFQTADYTFWEQRDELPVQLLPVSEVEVKAEIARPALREIIPTDAIYRVYGAAWTGESEVSRVELSTDGGARWEPAQLLGESVPYAWRLWEYYWRTPAEPGMHLLMARATDARGDVQPMQRDTHRGSYIISHVQPIEVEVRKLSATAASDAYAI